VPRNGPTDWWYDFGVSVAVFWLYNALSLILQDNWDHKIDFVSSSLISQNDLKLVGATGCGPLDDSGGVTGWEDVKAAFSSSNPTAHQKRWKSWAQEISPLGHVFDPSKAPNLEQLKGEFEKFATLCR
jgi:hypothetical protein